MARKDKWKHQGDFSHSFYLLSRLITYVMLMIAGDIAFSQYKDQKLGLKIDLLTERVEQQIKKVGDIETEIVILNGLKTAREEYFDERLDNLELFLAKEKGFNNKKSQREYLNEARILDLKEKRKKK